MLVDTGSTISIITDQPTPPGWVATKTRIATVTREQAFMKGRKALTVSIAGRTVQGRQQHFESGGDILAGGLELLPQKILKDVDAISRILVHLPCF